jgi:prepilin-type N-terminal cleavage/methylation domain-containing protein
MNTNARRAFTIVELMFVLVILGVLMTVALPKMTGSNDFSAVQTTARDMARLAAYARQAAVSVQRETRLVLDTEQGEWWLEIPEEGEDLDDRADRRRRERQAISTIEEPHELHTRVKFGEIQTPGRDLLGDDVIIVRFRPNGTSSGAVIGLESLRGTRFTVEIEEATGRPLAYQGKPRELGEKMEDLGVDISLFRGVEGSSPLGGVDDRPLGEGFRQTAGRTSEQRVSAYSDAAARLFGKVQNKVEREREAQRTAPLAQPGGQGVATQ